MPFKDGSPLGQTSVEFYRGLLLAVDSVKRQGLSVEVYAMDCGTTEASLSAVLGRGELQGMDIIFGPALASQTTALADYCKGSKTKLVIPFGTPCPQLGGNPNVYQATPRVESLYPNAVQLTMENLAGSNFVLVKCNELAQDDAAFQSLLSQQLSTYVLPNSILNVNADDVAAQAAFSAKQRNVIVPDSYSEGALTALIDLLNRYPQYKFSLLGSSKWLGLTDKYQNYLFALDTYIFTPYYYNRLTANVMKFGTTYSRNFNTPMRHDIPSAVLLGFDMGYYFLTGVSPSPYQQDFHFQRVSEQGGQINDFVQLVHFGTNKTITIVK